MGQRDQEILGHIWIFWHGDKHSNKREDFNKKCHSSTEGKWLKIPLVLTVVGGGEEGISKTNKAFFSTGLNIHNFYIKRQSFDPIIFLLANVAGFPQICQRPLESTEQPQIYCKLKKKGSVAWTIILNQWYGDQLGSLGLNLTCTRHICGWALKCLHLVATHTDYVWVLAQFKRKKKCHHLHRPW